MPTNKMYEGRAIIFDPNEYPDGWDNLTAQKDFIAAAIEECHHFLPEDWYIQDYHEDSRTIVVGLERYQDCYNLQPVWNFIMTADPVDEDDTQWIVYDVVRWQPNNLYSFQMP